MAAGRVAGIGTRPGLHGQTLISSGLADLDRLFGGGLPLGCLTLVLEDSCTSQHLNLLRYFIGEGVACGQSICWAGHSPPGESFGGFLPKIVEQSSVEEKSTNEKQKEEGLRIAWQYQRYIRDKNEAKAAENLAPPKRKSAFRRDGKKSQAALGVALNWSHAFDLSKQMGNEALENCPVQILLRGNYGSEVDEFIQQVQNQDVQGTRGRHVGRIVIQSLGSDHCTDAHSLLTKLYGIKRAVQGTFCSALLSIQPAFFSNTLVNRACHLADGVIALEPIDTDSDIYGYLGDPSSCSSWLQLKKTPGAGCMRKVGEEERRLHVIRRRPKRLCIEAVEVDPNAEAEQVATADKWQKSAAETLVLGSLPSLDF